MEIKERKIVGGLSIEEFEKVKEVGGVIGSIKKAFDADEITEIDDDTKNILTAIKVVVENVLCR